MFHFGVASDIQHEETNNSNELHKIVVVFGFYPHFDL